MNRQDWRAAAEALLTHARAVRAGAARESLGAVVWAGAPMPAGPPDDPACAAVWAAMGHLSDEVALVCSGGAGTLEVLDDEIEAAEAAVTRL